MTRGTMSLPTFLILEEDVGNQAAQARTITGRPLMACVPDLLRREADHQIIGLLGRNRNDHREITELLRCVMTHRPEDAS